MKIVQSVAARDRLIEKIRGRWFHRSNSQISGTWWENDHFLSGFTWIYLRKNRQLFHSCGSLPQRVPFMFFNVQSGWNQSPSVSGYIEQFWCVVSMVPMCYDIVRGSYFSHQSDLRWEKPCVVNHGKANNIYSIPKPWLVGGVEHFFVFP